jgi:hypothetical protein
MYLTNVLPVILSAIYAIAAFLDFSGEEPASEHPRPIDLFLL